MKTNTRAHGLSFGTKMLVDINLWKFLGARGKRGMASQTKRRGTIHRHRLLKNAILDMNRQRRMTILALYGLVGPPFVRGHDIGMTLDTALLLPKHHRLGHLFRDVVATIKTMLTK